MAHVLARHAALEAGKIKAIARGTLHATACGMGCKDAHHGYNAFQQEMDAVIAKAMNETQDPNQPAPEEIAFFETIERAALANQKTK
jgi:hypothetical protein